jgi:hypothetical protein
MEYPGHLLSNVKDAGIAPMMSAVIKGIAYPRMIQDAVVEIPRPSNHQAFPARLAAQWAVTAGAWAMPN